MYIILEKVKIQRYDLFWVLWR